MNLKPWLIIINPASAGGKGIKRWPRLMKALEDENIPFDHVIPEGAEGIHAALKESHEQGIRNFGILGGDGSLNLLVNSIMHLGLTLEDIHVALFPAGTGNDWRRTHGIRNDPRHVVELIRKNRFVRHDIARVEYNSQTSYFVNLLGAGLDAKAVEVYHRSLSTWPIGKLKYVLSLLVALFQYSRQQIRISYDGQEVYSGKFLNLNLAIGEYSGGGMHTVPHANFRDGKLELVLVPKIPFLKILVNLPGLFNGNYINLKEIKTFSAKEVELRFSQANRIEADGEIMEASERFRVEVMAMSVSGISLQCSP